MQNFVCGSAKPVIQIDSQVRVVFSMYVLPGHFFTQNLDGSSAYVSISPPGQFLTHVLV